MVTKLASRISMRAYSYILAKNHMVTKRRGETFGGYCCYILAKNHMVTKLSHFLCSFISSYILAKNHMVTKLE